MQYINFYSHLTHPAWYTLNTKRVVLLVIVSIGLLLACAALLFHKQGEKEISIAVQPSPKNIPDVKPVPLRQPPENIHLNGIVTRATTTWAIINGMPYRVGDSVLGYSITRITANAVYLHHSEGVFMIPLIVDIKEPG